MGTESHDPADDPRDVSAEAIADALARMRRRGPWRPHDPHAAHGEHDREHGRRGAGPHGRHGGPHGEAAWGQGLPWARGSWMGDVGGRHDFPARLRVLEALAAASGPLGVSELAAAVGVDQPRASRLVQQGVEQGWVRREADPDDARRTRIVLTDEGRAVLGGIRGVRRERLAAALEAFSDDERADLARLLTKLADNWEARPDERSDHPDA